MIKPKIKAELKEIDNVIKDFERLRNMNKRIAKRTKKNPNYPIKARKSIKKYTKLNFGYHNNIVLDIDCNKTIEEHEFKSEYEHFDKLTHHLSKLNSSNSKLTKLVLAIRKSCNNNSDDIISPLYLEEHVKISYKIIKYATFYSNINASQILAIITWVNNEFKKFLRQHNYYELYSKKIRYLIKHASRMYTVNINPINHKFLTSMIENAFMDNDKKESKWLDVVEGTYYTGIIKLLFSFLIENMKIVNDAKSKILNLYMFFNTLEYIKLFCTNYLTKLQESDTLTLNYIIANVNNSNKMVELFNKYLGIVQDKYKIKINKTRSTSAITTIIMLFIVSSSNFINLLVSYIINVLANVFKNVDCDNEYKNYMGNIICDTIDDYCINDIKPHLEAVVFSSFMKDLFNRVVTKIYTLLVNSNNFNSYEKCVTTIETHFIDILDDHEYVVNKIDPLRCFYKI